VFYRLRSQDSPATCQPQLAKFTIIHLRCRDLPPSDLRYFITPKPLSTALHTHNSNIQVIRYHILLPSQLSVIHVSARSIKHSMYNTASILYLGLHRTQHRLHINRTPLKRHLRAIPSSWNGHSLF